MSEISYMLKQSPVKVIILANNVNIVGIFYENVWVQLLIGCHYC